MKSILQKDAKDLALLCLRNSDFHYGYTDKDLENATLIFSHFLFDVVYSVNKGKLSDMQMQDLAETTGKAIRELIIASTGKDMHDIVKS